MKKPIIIGVLAFSMLLLAALEKAQAQFYFGGSRRGFSVGVDTPYFSGYYGRPSYRYGTYRDGYYPYGRSSWYYGPEYRYSSPGYVIYDSPPAYVVEDTRRRSFYEGPNGTDSRAQLRIRLPDANAKVWINDTLTRQEGAERTFISPILQPGDYTYNVKASWMENGSEIVREKQAQVRPGQETLVSFMDPVQGSELLPAAGKAPRDSKSPPPIPRAEDLPPE